MHAFHSARMNDNGVEIPEIDCGKVAGRNLLNLFIVSALSRLV